jgi:hypothetical protein
MSPDAADSVPMVRTPAGWLLCAVAAVVACGVVGVLLDQRLESHILPHRWGPDADEDMRNLRGERLENARAQLRTTHLRGGAIALGAIAGAVALALALVDAAKLRRPSSFVLAPLGAAVAAAAGVGGGYLAMLLHLRFEPVAPVVTTLTEAIMVQAVGWLCAGLGIAIGIWIASGGSRRFVDTIVGGLLAGGLVGVLYPVLASVLYADYATDRLYPGNGYFPPDRAFGYTSAFMFWAIFTGAVFAAVLGGVGKKAPATAESTPASAL